MEKTKRFYLKPQMEVMDVQTEGVVAASGGEVEIPEEKLNGIMMPQCVKDGSTNAFEILGECRNYRVNYGNSCESNWDNISPLAKTAYDVNIQYFKVDEAGRKIFKVTFNPKIKC